MSRSELMQRRSHALALAREGHSYDSIADELGYANRSGAWKAVQAALSSHEAQEVATLRELELRGWTSFRRGSGTRPCRET